jgi:small GTP-binding protein
MEAIPYRIAFLGSKEVGKTSIIIRYIRDTFDTCYIPTTQDLHEKMVLFNKKWYKLVLIDTAGQSEMQSVTTMAIKSADAFVIVYNCTDMTTFDAVDPFYVRAQQAASPGDPKVVIVANKCDHENRQVAEQQGNDIARDLKTGYIECSAKANINIAALFDQVLELLTGTKKELPAAKKKTKVTKRKKVHTHDACCELV